MRLLFVCFTALLSLLAACSQPTSEIFTLEGRTMGTSYSVKIVSLTLSTTQKKQSEHGVRSELDEVNRLMSSYILDSDVMRFNLADIGDQINISPLTTTVLKESLALHKMTRGKFDISLSPLVELWGFGTNEVTNTRPSAKAVKSALSHVNIQGVGVDENNNQLTKLRDIRLDLSAIAKGFAVDRVAEFLKSMGFHDFLVEVGGELRVSGLNLQGKPWVLGIETPDFPGRKAYNTLSLSTGSLATSGDYRNYFESNGRRYSHTIDPTTGYPVDHHLASVSVISEKCSTADALATALMVMGEVEGHKFALQNQIDAFFIYREGDLFLSKTSGRFDEFLNDR